VSLCLSFTISDTVSIHRASSQLPSHTATQIAFPLPVCFIYNSFCVIIITLITSGQSNLTTGCIATTHGRYSLYFTMGRPFPQDCPLPWAIRTPSNTWFLGPTRVHNPNSISIGSAVLQGSRSWQTSRPRHISNNRLHLPGTYVVLQCGLIIIIIIVVVIAIIRDVVNILIVSYWEVIVGQTICSYSAK